MESLREKTDIISKEMKENWDKISSHNYEIMPIEFEEPVTSKFSIQDENILNKVKPKNQNKAKQIITNYDLENTVFDILTVITKITLSRKAAIFTEKRSVAIIRIDIFIAERRSIEKKIIDTIFTFTERLTIQAVFIKP